MSRAKNGSSTKIGVVWQKSDFLAKNWNFGPKKEVPLLYSNHVLATTGKSCSKKKVAFSQINISLLRNFGSNANYDRWLRDSVISYVTFTFLSFILQRMILCASFSLSSLFTKVTSGKSSHFLFKSKPFSHLPKVSFDIWLMWLWL